MSARLARRGGKGSVCVTTSCRAQLSAKRKFAAAELGHRVTAMMADLAMAGGRVEISLPPLNEPTSFGREGVRIRDHDASEAAAGPALARRVGRRAVASRACDPGRAFRSRDGAHAGLRRSRCRHRRRVSPRRWASCCSASDGAARCYASLTCRRSLPAPTRMCVSASARAKARSGPSSSNWTDAPRVEEIARMLGGHEMTAKTRANAKELLRRAAEAHAPRYVARRERGAMLRRAARMLAASGECVRPRADFCRRRAQRPQSASLRRFRASA